MIGHTNKTTYGEVITPPEFARNMLLETLSSSLFKDPALKWLDIGAGRGCFGVALRRILNDTLADAIPDAAARDRHIITRMLHMVEINPDNVTDYLRPLFGLDANIHQADYLTWDPPPALHYDVVIGNPPFNCDGAIKVPTNSATDKRDDGRTVWPHFVRKTLALMRRCEQGKSATMCILIPSIWMKPADKSGIFDELVTSEFGTVSRLRCFTSLESNRIFRSGGGAQTPCCYFAYTHDRTNSNTKCIELRDNNADTGHTPYSVIPPRPIPLCGASIINKLLALMSRTTGQQHVRVLKTNMPGKGVTLSPGAAATAEHTHPCIHSCTIRAICAVDDNDAKKLPQLSIRYSSHPCAYAGVPKLVLAHKMYGYPYLDLTGEYGISNRDSYVIELVRGPDGAPDKAWAIQMMAYLSSPIALMVYDATRYRMQYLERYAFELLPMPPFPFSDAAHILGLTESEMTGLSRRRYRPLQPFPAAASTFGPA